MTFLTNIQTTIKYKYHLYLSSIVYVVHFVHLPYRLLLALVVRNGKWYYAKSVQTATRQIDIALVHIDLPVFG